MKWDYEEELLKYHVKVGGGEWVGLQEALPEFGCDPSVVFKTPDGTVLFLPQNVVDSTQVRWAISEHERKKNEKPVKVPRAVLVHIVDSLSKLLAEVKALIEEKR